MSSFNIAIDIVLKNEGELVESPNDPGGITKYGISFRFLKSIPKDRLKKYNIFIEETITEDDIKHLTLDQAKAIYFNEFWQHAPFEQLTIQPVANYVFDMCINMGISPGIKCAQRACCAMMKSRDALIDDGILGPVSLHVINSCGIYILPALRSERAGYYRLIAENGDSLSLHAWLNRAYNT